MSAACSGGYKLRSLRGGLPFLRDRSGGCPGPARGRDGPRPGLPGYSSTRRRPRTCLSYRRTIIPIWLRSPPPTTACWTRWRPWRTRSPRTKGSQRDRVPRGLQHRAAGRADGVPRPRPRPRRPAGPRLATWLSRADSMRTTRRAGTCPRPFGDNELTDTSGDPRNRTRGETPARPYRLASLPRPRSSSPTSIDGRPAGSGDELLRVIEDAFRRRHPRPRQRDHRHRRRRPRSPWSSALVRRAGRAARHGQRADRRRGGAQRRACCADRRASARPTC